MAEFRSGSSKGTVLTGQPMAVDPMRNPQGGSSKSKDMDWGYFAAGTGAAILAAFGPMKMGQITAEFRKAEAELKKLEKTKGDGVTLNQAYKNSNNSKMREAVTYSRRRMEYVNR